MSVTVVRRMGGRITSGSTGPTVAPDATPAPRVPRGGVGPGTGAQTNRLIHQLTMSLIRDDHALWKIRISRNGRNIKKGCRS